MNSSEFTKTEELEFRQNLLNLKTERITADIFNNLMKVNGFKDNIFYILSGSLRLYDSDLDIIFPKNLWIKDRDEFTHWKNVGFSSSLDICGSITKKWPENLIVDGTLISTRVDGDMLPENLIVGGFFCITGNKNINSLPKKFKFKGGIDISGTGISKIPNDMRVDGLLDIRSCHFSYLPKNLYVAEWLNVSNTGIFHLPADCTVVGKMLWPKNRDAILTWCDKQNINIAKITPNQLIKRKMEIGI